MDDPYQLDLPMLEVLAGSECWVTPRPHCPSRPWAVVFYVPSRLSHVVTRSFPPPDPRRRPPVPQADHLKLIE